MKKSYTIAVPTALPRQGTAFERAQHWVSIGGPIGLIPWVPATFASLATAALCWWARPGAVVIVILAVALFLVGGWTATTSERLLATEDPRNVVLDEIAGQLLTFVFLTPRHWQIALAGFVLFRIFDIAKPFPIRRLERLPGGWGIMADDLLAGLYAAIVLFLLHHWQLV